MSRQREIVAALNAVTNDYSPFSFDDKLSVTNLNRSNEDGVETTHVTLQSWLIGFLIFFRQP